MIVQLVLRGGSIDGKIVTIHSDRFVIGRSHECDLKVNSGALSRRHAVIETHNRIVTIQDLDSTNGTYLNGRKISDTMGLHDTDILHLGPLDAQVRIIVHKSNAPSSSTVSLAAADTHSDEESSSSQNVDVDLSALFNEDSSENAERFHQSLSVAIEESKIKAEQIKTMPPKVEKSEPQPDQDSRQAASKALEAMFRKSAKK